MQSIRFQPLHTSEVQKLLYKLKITGSSLFVFSECVWSNRDFWTMRSSRPTELRIGQHSPSGEVHFSINKTPSLQFPPIPERATQMVRQAQEKVGKDKTSQHVELGGPAARASSDLVTFLRGRRMRTADRRGPRLRQRTDTERKETRDRQNRKKKAFAFPFLFYCFLLWTFLFFCLLWVLFALHFLDSKMEV